MMNMEMVIYLMHEITELLAHKRCYFFYHNDADAPDTYDTHTHTNISDNQHKVDRSWKG